LLLLLPSLALGLSPRAVAAAQKDDSKSISSSSSSLDADDATKANVASGSRHRVPTRDAPVDGKDGKPHLGPFVGTDGIAVDANGQKLPPLKGRPDDLTLVDGQKIPKTNDGVMFDKNRDRPEKGVSTGTEGGVTEKSNARKEKEGKTGEKVLTQPEAPKEQPPLPHSEERKIRGGKEESVDKSKASAHKEVGNTDYTGLDVSRCHGLAPTARYFLFFLFQTNSAHATDHLFLGRNPMASLTPQTNPNPPQHRQKSNSNHHHPRQRTHPQPKLRLPVGLTKTESFSRFTRGCYPLP
jgi:hypothetical protein